MRKQGAAPEPLSDVDNSFQYDYDDIASPKQATKQAYRPKWCDEDSDSSDDEAPYVPPKFDSDFSYAGGGDDYGYENVDYGYGDEEQPKKEEAVEYGYGEDAAATGYGYENPDAAAMGYGYENPDQSPAAVYGYGESATAEDPDRSAPPRIHSKRRNSCVVKRDEDNPLAVAEFLMGGPPRMSDKDLAYETRAGYATVIT